MSQSQSHTKEYLFQIPTQVGYRPEPIIFKRPQNTLKTIHRDNKKVQALSLPNLTNFNMRSIFSKIFNLAQDAIERESDAIFLTEVWQKIENKKHQFKIEQMLEMKGIKYISTPRPGAKRGGGAAIAVRLDRFSISKLNIAIPHSIEIVWGLLRPKVTTGKISTIIVSSFYCPPRSRKKSILIDHMTETLQSLLKIHKNAGVIISGDRNDLEISSLLSIDPSLRQIVQNPTRGSKILDIFLTNLGSYYNIPTIIPPIAPDNPAYGAPSDHRGVEVTPVSGGQHQSIMSTRVKKYIRPLPESLLPRFETKLSEHVFDLSQCPSVHAMVDVFQSDLNRILCETFPQKQIIISPHDVPWFTEKLRQLKRRRQRHYVRHGKDDRYKEIYQQFEDMFRTEMNKYKQRIENEVLDGKRGSTYPTIKKMGIRPFDNPGPEFELPRHSELGFNSQQSAEIIAEHFATISQEYKPLNAQELPQNIQFLLNNCDIQSAPTLSVREVLQRIKKAKKPNSVVPGDLPRKLVQSFAPLLAYPVATIFNSITKTAQFPTKWKVEHQIAIPKLNPPENEDDLRNLAKTNFFSKVYESFIAQWLLPIIKPYLDPDQCGLRGFSITHYLIKLLHFIQSTLDTKKPQAVLAACIDLSKAFNRIDHSLLIQDLYDMHTPGWLLKIIISYLSDRSMFMTYNNSKSSLKKLPGGGPQGAYLGGLIFIIKYNGALLRPPVDRPYNLPISKSKSQKVKFVDDGTVAVSVDLRESLIPDPEVRTKPLKYHERTGHVLPAENNLLQHYIRDTENFIAENKLQLNKKKTKIMSFTKSRKLDFPPEVKFSDGTKIECITHTKLVGVVVSEDLRWYKNTEYICQKARKKLWILRRLAALGFNKNTLYDVYTKEVRSILELAVPVWHSGLTLKQSQDIERIQKIAFRIILGSDYLSYQLACLQMSAQTLQSRRLKLCLKFSMKNLKSENCLFEKIDRNVKTRKQDLVKEFKTNTTRYQNSSLPFLARLINSEHKKKK